MEEYEYTSPSAGFVEKMQAILKPMEIGWMEIMEYDDLMQETMEAVMSGTYRGLCLGEKIDGYQVYTNTVESAGPYFFIVRRNMNPQGEATVFYETGNDEKCDAVVNAIMEEHLPASIAPEMEAIVRKELRKVVLVFFSDMKTRPECQCQNAIEDAIR